MSTRGQSYARTPAWMSWMPAPEPASTRKRSSPSESSVAGPRRAGFGGGEPVPRRTARTFAPHPALSPQARGRGSEKPPPLATGEGGGEGAAACTKYYELARGRGRRAARTVALVHANGHRQLRRLALTHHGELDDLADGRARDDALQIARLLDGRAVHGQHHVVG